MLKKSKTFRATIVPDGSMCFMPLTFDPKTVCGKMRAPAKVTLNGYTYRSTIASMGGQTCIPLRRTNREAAGLEGGETLEITLVLDTEKREVTPPTDASLSSGRINDHTLPRVRRSARRSVSARFLHS